MSDLRQARKTEGKHDSGNSRRQRLEPEAEKRVIGRPEGQKIAGEEPQRECCERRRPKTPEQDIERHRPDVRIAEQQRTGKGIEKVRGLIGGIEAGQISERVFEDVKVETGVSDISESPI